MEAFRPTTRVRYDGDAGELSALRQTALRELDVMPGAFPGVKDPPSVPTPFSALRRGAAAPCTDRGLSPCGGQRGLPFEIP